MTLYINTSNQRIIEVALRKGGHIMDKLSDENQYGSQVLLPLIEKLLKKNNLDYKDLEGIEVDEGPGSYTGLKVGASVAQALGWTLNIPVNGRIGKPVQLKYT